MLAKQAIAKVVAAAWRILTFVLDTIALLLACFIVVLLFETRWESPLAFIALAGAVVGLSLAALFYFGARYAEKLWREQQFDNDLEEAASSRTEKASSRREKIEAFFRTKLASGRRGKKLLTEKLKNQETDSQSILLGPYALFLRPFEWDHKVRSRFWVTPDTKELVLHLLHRKDGPAIWAELLFLDKGGVEQALNMDLQDLRDLRDFNLNPLIDKVLLDVKFLYISFDIFIEELFSLFLVDDMPFIGLGETSFEQSDLGFAFEYSSADLWHSDILELMKEAKIVLLIPGTSSGADWELDQIIASPQLWRKTLLLIPGIARPHRHLSQALPDAEVEELKPLNDQLQNVKTLIAKKGLAFSGLDPFLTGGAYELVSYDGQVYQCRMVFSFGRSKTIFDDLQQWYRRATEPCGDPETSPTRGAGRHSPTRGVGRHPQQARRGIIGFDSF